MSDCSGLFCLEVVIMVVAVGKVNVSALLDGAVFPKCEVMCTDSLTEIAAQNSIVVLGKGARIPEKLTVFAAVVNADDELLYEKLRGNAVVTCGIGSRNTISVTSKTAERITLSLNRAIHTLSGLCEPLELPMPVYKGYSDYDHMAVFAAALLSGGERILQ